MNSQGFIVFCFLLGIIGCQTGPAGRPVPPPPVDEKEDRLKTLEKGAGLAVEKFNYGQALVAFERALEQAELFDDGERIRDYSHNIAWCLLKMDRAAEASVVLRRARAECGRRGIPWPGDSQLLLAEAEFMAGNPSGSQEELRQVAHDGEGGRSFPVQFLTALNALALGKRSLAEASLAELPEPESIGEQADRDYLAGQIALAKSEYADAGAAFQRAAELRLEAGNPTGMANALAGAGEAWLGAGDLMRAADLYFRAGRSALHADRSEKAREWLSEARRLDASSTIQSQAEELLKRL